MDLFLLSGDPAGVYTVPPWAAEPTRKGTIPNRPPYKIPEMGAMWTILWGFGAGAGDGCIVKKNEKKK